MTQGTYEAAIARLRSLGAMRTDLQQRLGKLQAHEWSRDGRGAQLLSRSLQDIDAELIIIQRQIVRLQVNDSIAAAMVGG